MQGGTDKSIGQVRPTEKGLGGPITEDNLANYRITWPMVRQGLEND